MLKIIIPVSLVTFLLDFSGWLGRMDGLLEQLMGVIHLPAMAALPLLAGLLTGIYGTIAAMSVLPFSSDQMILMAVFLLIAHSLIQEGWVQHQSGCNAWMATAVRLAAAVLTVVVLGWLLGPATLQKTVGEPLTAAQMTFWVVDSTAGRRCGLHPYIPAVVVDKETTPLNSRWSRPCRWSLK